MVAANDRWVVVLLAGVGNWSGWQIHEWYNILIRWLRSARSSERTHYTNRKLFSLPCSDLYSEGESCITTLYDAAVESLLAWRPLGLSWSFTQLNRSVLPKSKLLTFVQLRMFEIMFIRFYVLTRRKRSVVTTIQWFISRCRLLYILRLHQRRPVWSQEYEIMCSQKKVAKAEFMCS